MGRYNSGRPTSHGGGLIPTPQPGISDSLSQGANAMKRTIFASSALALVLAAPAVFAQQSGGQEMDHSQHMMQSPPPAQAQQQPPGRQPGMGGMGRGGMMG